MKNYNIFIITLLAVVLLSACNRGGKVTRTDTETSGIATIASDESFAPIIEEELAVFTGLNPEADITPLYTSEPELFKLLLEDSIRLIVAARDITEQEKKIISQNKLNPRTQKIAIDGIALIINKENKDSLATVDELKKIMTGEITKWSELSASSKSNLGEIKVVFDNPNSSTLRFINDSISRGATLSNRLSALENNKAVMDYVGRTPNAMGVIGVNWISNPNDTTKLTFKNTIRVMAISRDSIPTYDNSYQPVPAYLATREYPLVRELYLILTDSRGGLPAGFVKFFAGDSGQRIVLKAGLVPATAPTRLINMQESF